MIKKPTRLTSTTHLNDPLKESHDEELPEHDQDLEASLKRFLREIANGEFHQLIDEFHIHPQRRSTKKGNVKEFLVFDKSNRYVVLFDNITNKITIKDIILKDKNKRRPPRHRLDLNDPTKPANHEVNIFDNKIVNRIDSVIIDQFNKEVSRSSPPKSKKVALHEAISGWLNASSEECQIALESLSRSGNTALFQVRATSDTVSAFNQAAASYPSKKDALEEALALWTFQASRI